MRATTISLDIAAAAARLVIDEGLDYANAKRKAARSLGEGLRSLPSDEVVEDHVREHIAIFHPDTQARELAAMRRLALVWMTRLEAWNPYLAGAVWRGTATARTVLRIELYADDAKLAQFALLDQGIDEHVPECPGHERSEAVLSKHVRVPGLGDMVAIDFVVYDADALRGALKPDGRGRTWRGDARALRDLVALEHAGDAPHTLRPQQPTR